MSEELLKNSNTDRIDLISNKWKKRKLKYICSSKTTNISTENITDDATKYKVFGASGLMGYIESKGSDNDYIGIVKDGAGAGRLDFYPANSSLLGTMAYIIPNQNTNLKWLMYTMQSLNLGDSIDKTTIPHIYFSEYGNNYVCYPSLEEQTKIANFLDEKISQIDNAISKTKKSIEEYKKLKQSIITEAVTKGLDPNVEMKDSGNIHIGQCPKHWEVKKFKYIAKSLFKGNGISKEEVYEDGDINCVRYGEIYTKYNEDFDKCFSKTKLDDKKTQIHINEGDILFSGTGELIEEIGKNVVYMGKKDCLAGGDIIVCKHTHNPIFLNYSLNSSYSQEQKSKGKAKLKVVHISASEIGNIVVPLPPREEQDKIAKYLKEKSIELSRIISNKEKIIEELEQYKKSLIYEYVTGKKEVA